VSARAAARAALATLLLAGGTAPAEEPPPLAVLGLRPTEDAAALEGTAIVRLSEAQQLRLVLESVLEALSGGRVLGHEALRASLGRAYLVALFDCRGAAACQLEVAGPLRALGVTTALTGDYAAGEAAFHVRLRRLDLVRERVAEELTFDLPVAEAGSLAPWRAALAPLFADTGSIRLVVNQPEAQCQLDGKPCRLSAEGELPDVAEGEHLLAVAKDGFKRAERVVAVRRGQQTRLAVALEELPVQAQKAPDPAARLPTFEKPTEEPQVKPFGSLRLAFLVDDVAAGEREDPFVPTGLRPGGSSLVVLPRPAVLGVGIQSPRRESGWQTRGALSLAWVKDAGPEIDSAYAEVLQEEQGLRFQLGWGPSIVSSLTAGTLTFPEAFGDLSFGAVGLTTSHAFGPVLAELFVGKHKAQFSPEPSPRADTPLPMGALHLAYVDKGRPGTLYGDEYPLTVGLSALLGQERVGTGDEPDWAAAQGLAPPRQEDVRVWVVSLEGFVPLGAATSLAGEAWIGDDVRLLEGAAWQPPRIDPASGHHRPLRSAGGWVQVASQVTEAVELRLVAGIDRALANLAWGRPVGDVAAIRDNRLAAASAIWKVGQLALGLQLHALRTSYAGSGPPPAVLLGLAATSQLVF